MSPIAPVARPRWLARGCALLGRVRLSLTSRREHEHGSSAFSCYTARNMRLYFLVLLCVPILTVPTHAQWSLQESHTTASLRGIHNVGAGVAWASGSNGTALRTEDGGHLWHICAVPPGAEHLDFRGVQAFNKNTAVVMSSGKGDLSRLYKTADGCKTWKLVLINPDAPAGFYDTLLFVTPELGLVLGDPATGSIRNPVEGGYFIFRIRVTRDGGETWIPIVSFGNSGVNLTPLANEGFFAASNTSAVLRDGSLWVGTSAGRVIQRKLYDRTRCPKIYARRMSVTTRYWSALI